MESLTTEQSKLLENIALQSDKQIFNIGFWKDTQQKHPILNSITPQKLMNLGIQARLCLIKQKPNITHAIDLSEISSSTLLQTIPIQPCAIPEHTYIIQFTGTKRTFSKSEQHSQYHDIDKKVHDICDKYKTTKKEVLQRMCGHNGDINQVLLSFHDPAIQDRIWKDSEDDMLMHLYSKRTKTELEDRAAFLEISISK